MLQTVQTILIPITENPTALAAPPDVNMSHTRGCVVLRDLLGYQRVNGRYEFTADDLLKRVSSVTEDKIAACTASPVKSAEGVRRTPSPISIGGVPLLVGRTRRRLGLHRRDVALQPGASGDQADGAVAPTSWSPASARGNSGGRGISRGACSGPLRCCPYRWRSSAASSTCRRTSSRSIVGVVLWLSAARFLLNPGSDDVLREPGRPAALSIGAGLGLLSGLTGVGGGIFLTPLLLFMRWARTKTAAAVSALFILSIRRRGCSGHVARTRHVPSVALVLAVTVIVGRQRRVLLRQPAVRTYGD